jgi:RHS repeat-associated protein
MNKAAVQYVQLVYFYRLLLIRQLALFNLLSLLAENLSEEISPLEENENAKEPPLEPVDWAEKGHWRRKDTAQEEDPETSLMYYGARYYDPAIGRFITADSVVPGSDSLFKQNRGNSHSGLLSYHSNPKSPALNRYMYVSDNPIQYKDPSGHIDWPGLLVGLAIIAVGAAIIIFAAPIAAAIGLSAVVIGGFTISAASIVAGIGLAIGYLGYTIGQAAGNDCVSTCNIGFQTEFTANTDWGQGGGSGGGSSGGGGGSDGGSGGSGDSILYNSMPEYREPETQRFLTDYSDVDSYLSYIPNICPMFSGCRVTSSFGNRNGEFHNGTDFGGSDSVVATMSGRVYDIGYNDVRGNYVYITNTRYQVGYLHLSRTYVSVGDYVYQGEIIGISGNTGNSTATHLHYWIYQNGNYLNPMPLINSFGNNSYSSWSIW